MNDDEGLKAERGRELVEGILRHASRFANVGPQAGRAAEDLAAHAVAHAHRGEYEAAFQSMYDAVQWLCYALRGGESQDADAGQAIGCHWCEARAGDTLARPGSIAAEFAEQLERGVAKYTEDLARDAARGPDEDGPRTGDARPWRRTTL